MAREINDINNFMMMAAAGMHVAIEDEEDQDLLNVAAVLVDEKEEHFKNEDFFEVTVPSVSESAKIHFFSEHIHKMLNGTSENIYFQSHFRMSRESFQRLSLMLAPDLNTEYSNISVEKKLAIALWYFGNQEVYRSISDRFGVAKSTAWECVLEVAHSLSWRANNFIRWPTGQDLETTVREFENLAGFPDVIGVIDGCYIPISAPTDNPASYVNRKGFHAVTLQGICDHQRRFIDVFAGSCGSLHDARVWERSPINQESTAHYNNYFPNQTHILGDKAYTQQFNIMAPYKDYGDLSPIQKYYNSIHAKTRQIIERTFALLLGRFRRLKYLYLQNVEYASLIILACCILHNICIDFNDVVEGDEVNFNDILNEDDDDNVVLPEMPPGIENFQFDANRKRDILANILFNLRNE